MNIICCITDAITTPVSKSLKMRVNTTAMIVAGTRIVLFLIKSLAIIHIPNSIYGFNVAPAIVTPYNWKKKPDIMVPAYSFFTEQQ